MAMRKSRISQTKQDRLIEHFIAGTTARMAARLVGVHRNSSAFYFQRLRDIIAKELEAESEAMFGGELKVDESNLVAGAKASVGAEQLGKSLYFAYLSVVERFMLA